MNVLIDSAEHETAPLASPAGDSDYARVSAAVKFVTEHRDEQPDLAVIAAHVGLSSAHFQRLFTRWAGVSPKLFLQALTLDRAKRLLREEESVMGAAHALGLSGQSRLHDLFLAQEAMTPGSYKTGGAGLEIAYGFHETPFGDALLMQSQHGLVGVAFADHEEDRPRVLADMCGRWPKAHYHLEPEKTQPVALSLFGPPNGTPRDIRISLIGTDFEIRVWRRLLDIPFGEVTSYGKIAADLGCPKASRAVGRAVGRNPLSFVVPCHRVLGKSGSLTGYHWGLTRKRVLLGWEAALLQR
ncbi:bifunctional helix-turn-helix domain-containing protein/methylated-DNA--[protein]-cysteine S-methyltransferase [Methyloligella sp. 2.7D]|uniref:methylated-DNA--[protein]-cysteine S-methyltransferase n=1 Tax=unclassified Methyloligella TaxID=2625955 RepID=UPI00157CEA47|nr:bifunctional helix-turn-helix domain-containing protein/methylated-DNA--[protein]-cysteine S-methyltransferase [Methyloligella sp. GL2]QKP76302.1 methylated-DNA--[protein]-cysteine S-methyltransferase [Methyloligella sp. GL2]